VKIVLGFPSLPILLLSIPPVLWAITFHEFCHGYASYKLGDPTPAVRGRLTLNPLAHLDPVGALMLLLFRFGWAKPVPVDPRYYKNPKRDILIVSAAGVTGNIMSALACGLIARFLPLFLLRNFAFLMLLQMMVIINLGLAVFNLIPIPPLDGSKLIYPLLPRSLLQKYFWLERYGMFVLMALLFLGVIQGIMGPVVRTLYHLFMPSYLWIF